MMKLMPRHVSHILKSANSALYSLCFAVALLIVTSHVSAQMQVQTIKPLLIVAIDHGNADGVLVGPVADAMATQFGSHEPIRVSVRAVKPLTDPECRRLEVTTSQASVVEAGKRPAPKKLVYEINFCRDGRFPEDRLGSNNR